VSIAEKFVRIREGKDDGATRRLFMTVAEGAVLFTVASWAFDLVIALVAPRAFEHGSSSYSQIVVMLMAVLVPDGLAAWWIFRRVRTNRSRNDACRAATAFAVSAPLALGVSYLLGELVGGYAEVVLGRHFVLPAVAAAITVLMIFIPNGAVMWALHPSGGVEPVPESDQNEHC
jgi:hypothetical protein